MQEDFKDEILRQNKNHEDDIYILKKQNENILKSEIEKFEEDNIKIKEK